MWLGHVQRRGENQLVKRVWTEIPDEIKILGRPRKQWINQVLENFGRIESDLGMTEDVISGYTYLARPKSIWDLNGYRSKKVWTKLVCISVFVVVNYVTAIPLLKCV